MFWSSQAKDKILFRIKESLELDTPASIWNAKLMIQSYRDLFGDCKEVRAWEKKVNQQNRQNRPQSDNAQ